MKIRELRENEDVQSRQNRMKLDAQKQQTIGQLRWRIATWFSGIEARIMLYGWACRPLVGTTSTSSHPARRAEQAAPAVAGACDLQDLAARRFAAAALPFDGRLPQRHGHEFDDVVLHAVVAGADPVARERTANAKQRGMPPLHIMFFSIPPWRENV